MKKIFLPLIGLFLISISCEKNVSEQSNNSASKDVTINDDIKCINGVLVFKDQFSLSNYEDKANRMGISELIKQEESLGFESQKRIFEKIALIEYNRQVTASNGKTDEEIKNIPFPGYSPDCLDALKKGLIKEINEPEGRYIDYNLTDRSVAVYLNKDGLVMVGNTLCFIKGNSIKSMENATLANSRELIESSSSKTESSNSIVKSVLSGGTYTAYRSPGWNTIGNFRASLDATYVIQSSGYDPGPDYGKIIKGYPLTIHTVSQKKIFPNRWVSYWGSHYISGNASLQLLWSQIWYGPYTETNGLYNSFPTDYYFASATNATVKYNAFYGYLDPFTEYWTVTAPYDGWYGWGTKPISFNITAGLPGGCCGISCNVVW